MSRLCLLWRGYHDCSLPLRVCGRFYAPVSVWPQCNHDGRSGLGWSSSLERCAVGAVRIALVLVALLLVAAPGELPAEAAEFSVLAGLNKGCCT